MKVVLVNSSITIFKVNNSLPILFTRLINVAYYLKKNIVLLPYCKLKVALQEILSLNWAMNLAYNQINYILLNFVLHFIKDSYSWCGKKNPDVNYFEYSFIF